MRSVCFMLLSALLFSLMACEPSHQQQKQASAAKDEEKDIIPLSAEKADGAEGWLTNSTILYTASDPTKTELFFVQHLYRQREKALSDRWTNR